jgi:hypothetical protein
MELIARVWPLIVLAADIVMVAVRLTLLGVALVVAGNAAFLSLLQTDVPWTGLIFGAAYLVACAYLLAAVGEALAGRCAQ